MLEFAALCKATFRNKRHMWTDLFECYRLLLETSVKCETFVQSSGNLTKPFFMNYVGLVLVSSIDTNALLRHFFGMML